MREARKYGGTGVLKCARHLLKIALAAVLAAALLPFVSPDPAYAAAVNLYPNAAGDSTALTPYPGTGEAWGRMDLVDTKVR